MKQGVRSSLKNPLKICSLGTYDDYERFPMSGGEYRASAISALIELHYTVTLQCLDSMSREEEDTCLKMQQKKA